MTVQTCWQQVAAAKRASTYSKIPIEWRLGASDLDRASRQRNLTGSFIEQFLTSQEVKITRLSAVDLLDELSKRHLTAVDVCVAFCKRAAMAQQVNNCLHEIFFEQAIDRAQKLDAHFDTYGEAFGPLHGLPISLKDQFHVKGNDTSMGYIGWLNSYEGSDDPALVHKVDSQVVTELLNLGAVLYCKTSVPQTLLFGETINNLNGTTMCPVNQNLACGGSSGGEGALQALGGSPLGLGTDIGTTPEPPLAFKVCELRQQQAGSVRIPAAFNGIFSIKPSQHRFSYRKVANVIPGETTYPSSVGFMSPTQDILPIVMRSILSTDPWLRDPHVAPIPWRQHIVEQTLARANANGQRIDGQKSLKIGILRTDGVVTPHPPIQRGLRIVEEAIKNAGHQIFTWQPPSQWPAFRIHNAFLEADGAHDINRQLALSGEPLIEPLRERFSLRPGMPANEYQDLTKEGRAYEEAYLEYWNGTGKDDGQIVDAVLMPVAPHAAVLPGKYYHVAYTEAINLMDYTSAVIPVGWADHKIDIADPDYEPLSDYDAMNWKAYDAELYDGAPIGLQIVGRKYEEEKIWAIGKMIKSMLNGSSAK